MPKKFTILDEVRDGFHANKIKQNALAERDLLYYRGLRHFDCLLNTPLSNWEALGRIRDQMQILSRLYTNDHISADELQLQAEDVFSPNSKDMKKLIPYQDIRNEVSRILIAIQNLPRANAVHEIYLKKGVDAQLRALYAKTNTNNSENKLLKSLYLNLLQLRENYAHNKIDRVSFSSEAKILIGSYDAPEKPDTENILNSLHSSLNDLPYANGETQLNAKKVVELRYTVEPLRFLARQGRAFAFSEFDHKRCAAIQAIHEQIVDICTLYSYDELDADAVRREARKILSPNSEHVKILQDDADMRKALDDLLNALLVLSVVGAFVKKAVTGTWFFKTPTALGETKTLEEEFTRLDELKP
jgi:hypothetical protein